MKCSRCGKRFNSLPAMSRHYRKKHPQAMKRKVKRMPKAERSSASGCKFCPNCGYELG